MHTATPQQIEFDLGDETLPKPPPTPLETPRKPQIETPAASIWKRHVLKRAHVKGKLCATALDFDAVREWLLIAFVEDKVFWRNLGELKRMPWVVFDGVEEKGPFGTIAAATWLKDYYTAKTSVKLAYKAAKAASWCELLLKISSTCVAGKQNDVMKWVFTKPFELGTSEDFITRDEVVAGFERFYGSAVVNRVWFIRDLRQALRTHYQLDPFQSVADPVRRVSGERVRVIPNLRWKPRVEVIDEDNLFT